ncbi:LysM peptidoglycan-binding domain-containing protein [Psychrosphaera sp. B3R10]|uniref:LysM peptidoglycan-binding domain-containing protein n=1 Tax=unclassified Psychrosphaera TaxID=2641570 RepID=UPI001C085E6B|nr:MULTISPECIES: LysM domain-containing protein [unclassified Psychrosphaera]MBU2883244.1 LysM peptidoglycan-binding domain-containing protein [Psychrosphaera sp. I2R16]MBU2990662.1 LysM peptidoglycan-binding domain-containing protein [Psychrosphaera sp. B3R10]MDO6718864.1 LysM domain-containing protein [Psychrosphaera sp. 1_MG-2023]
MANFLRQLVSVIVFLGLSATASYAETLRIKSDAPSEYVVKKGDTLWDISSLFLKDPWKWPELWKMNPQVSNPNLIYPGDNLQLIYTASGEPVLIMGKRVLKMSPQKRVSHKRDEPIPLVPLNSIAPFLSYEQTLEEDVIEGLPYVLGTDRAIKRATVGDMLYIKGDLGAERRFAIYRKGKKYIDPETDDILGYEAVLVAIAKLEHAGDPDNGVPAKVTIESAKQEVKASDVLLPIRQGQDLPAFFKMRPIENDLEGAIIGTPSDVAGVSKYDVIVINKGFMHDVAPGHIFDVRRQSPTVVNQGLGPKYQEDASSYERFVGQVKNWFQSDEDKGIYVMPYEKIGQVMLFRVYERVSYGIVIKNSIPIYVGDKIQTPE